MASWIGLQHTKGGRAPGPGRLPLPHLPTGVLLPSHLRVSPLAVASFMCQLDWVSSFVVKRYSEGAQ